MYTDLGVRMPISMTISLEPELKRRFEQLAEVTNRSKSSLAVEALRNFIELYELQIYELKKAVREADSGDFASDQEVGNMYAKWGVNTNID